MKSPILGALVIVGLLALVIWLDRRDEREKNERRAQSTETPPNRNLREGIQAAHHPHPTEEEHRSRTEAHWHRQIQVERWALGLSAIALAAAIAGYISLRSQTNAAWEAVREAKRQTAVSEDALIASTRPWVKLNGMRIDRLEIKNNSVVVSAKFDYTNIGRSPATHILPNARILTDIEGGREVTKPSTFCRIAKGEAWTMIGESLFPGDQSSTWLQFNRPVNEVRAVLPPLPKLIADHTAFVVAGCILYTFDGSPDIHVTSFFFNLTRSRDHPEILPDGNPTDTFGISHEEMISSDGLRWWEEPIGRFAN